MTSIFQRARQDIEEEPEEISSIFSDIKRASKENIIPPIGIAKPELVESFMENMGDEEQILKDIADAESYERENPLQTATRETASHGARALEGLFGGINQFLNLMTPELYENEEGMPYGPGEQPKGLPGPHELHEFTKEKTGKYLEPKSKTTQTSHETISDIGTMFSTPGLGFFKKLLLPIGGQAVKQAIKSSGGSEKSQEIGKLGFMGIASIANLGNAPRVAAQAMNDVRNAIPQGLRFSARPTEMALNNIRSSPWFSTGRTSIKGPAMDEINRIERAIQNGTLDAHEAMQLRVDINEAREQLGAFNFLSPVPIRGRRRALHYLNDVDNALMASIENYGNNINPQWLHNYRLANQAFAVTQRSRLISDFIEQNAKPLQSDAAKILFHAGAATAGLKLPALAAATIPAAAAGKTIQVMNRMIRSPILRNHYLDVLRYASAGNAAMMQKSLQKFDISSKKLEEKEKSEK